MWNNKNSIEDMIIFEDKDILVCHKAAGIAVQNARIGAADMESSLKNYLALKIRKQFLIWELCTDWINRLKGFWYLQRIKSSSWSDEADYNGKYCQRISGSDR